MSTIYVGVYNTNNVNSFENAFRPQITSQVIISNLEANCNCLCSLSYNDLLILPISKFIREQLISKYINNYTMNVMQLYLFISLFRIEIECMTFAFDYSALDRGFMPGFMQL